MGNICSHGVGIHLHGYFRTIEGKTMNAIAPISNDKGEWYADTNSISVRPACKGDACNCRFTSYSDAVRYLVWNAMLGCKFSHDDVVRAKIKLAQEMEKSAERCEELSRAMKLMEQIP